MMMNKRRGAAGVKAMLKKRALTPYSGGIVGGVGRMNLLGANPQTQLTAEELQSGKVNYFLGNDPSKWRSNISLYGRVNYRNIYPGVNLIFRGASQRLEFDYVVSPGSDPRIALGFEGANSLHIDTAGNLSSGHERRVSTIQPAGSVPIEERHTRSGGREVCANGEESSDVRSGFLRSQS